MTMTSGHAKNLQKPKGKLGILIPGLGAVATTFIAGVESIRKGYQPPIGSVTQMGHIRLGKRTDNRQPLVKDFVPLADLNDIVFGGWDIFEDNCYESAINCGVLPKEMLDKIAPFMKSITPMKAVFDKEYVKKIDGPNVKTGKSKMDLAEQLMKDIENFKKSNNCDRLVMVWCASTEVYRQETTVHSSIKNFEEGLRNSDPNIAPSQMYAYAAMKMRVPFCNGAPNLCVDTDAIRELAMENGVCISGKDFKTGQTLMKTILAPGLKARMLGVSGWFSTNILGNRDGEVLDDPESFKTKEVSKLSVLESILQKDAYPTLYKDLFHKVRINYYPPRGDNKESWDNIDIVGWMGMPMQIKINFLCRDSILAAPVVLDLVIFTDFAQRAGYKGVLEWLSFYYKSPMTAKKLYPEHDLFIQLMKLKNNLRYAMGEDLITHLGVEYYD